MKGDFMNALVLAGSCPQIILLQELKKLGGGNPFNTR